MYKKSVEYVTSSKLFSLSSTFHIFLSTTVNQLSMHNTFCLQHFLYKESVDYVTLTNLLSLSFTFQIYLSISVKQ